MAIALLEETTGLDPSTTRPPLGGHPSSTRTTACEQAFEAMPRCAGRALRQDVKTGARLMLAKPWRIQRALFGNRLGSLPDRIDELIVYADRRQRMQEAAGLAGHWTYSFNRHLALRQAMLALRLLRRAGVAELDPLW